MSRRRPAAPSRALLAAALLAGAGLLAPACGKLMSPPPRPRTDGYSGLVTVRAGEKVLARFRIAVRGEAVRRSTSDLEDAPYFVRETAKGPVWEVNPAAKSYREATPEALFAQLDDWPLGPDFNHVAEASRRGVKAYHRESDAVFAGTPARSGASRTSPTPSALPRRPTGRRRPWTGSSSAGCAASRSPTGRTRRRTSS